MGGLSSAVDWWEVSQLRVLVLSSLVVQWILLLSSFGRRKVIPWWFRSIIWMAYLGSDALAIYGLATLFNRHKNIYGRSGSIILEVVWAAVLLMHLGGQEGITAYDMEDNELWTRYVATAVSQITVSIYVFNKSWPQGGDNKLLQVSIILFFVGIVKCMEKPWALKSASINSLVSCDGPAESRANREAGGANPLQNFVQQARQLFCTPSQEEEEIKVRVVRAAKMHINRPFELFVGLAFPYPHRLCVLQSFSVLNAEQLYLSLQTGLNGVLSRLYTKLKGSGFPTELENFNLRKMLKDGRNVNKLLFTYLIMLCGQLIRWSPIALPFAAIGLFHRSNREAYNDDDDDVKITYTLFVCGAVVEVISLLTLSRAFRDTDTANLFLWCCCPMSVGSSPWK
jgi:hypothetical protein